LPNQCPPLQQQPQLLVLAGLQADALAQSSTPAVAANMDNFLAIFFDPHFGHSVPSQ